MNMESRETKKERSLKRLAKSFGYASEGFIYAFKYEQNILVHILISVIVVITGLLLKISFLEWAILVVIMTMVIALELINTSLEAMVDLVTDKIHPLAKVIKDCASAAVLVMTIGAMIAGLIIFVPKIF